LLILLRADFVGAKKRLTALVVSADGFLCAKWAEEELFSFYKLIFFVAGSTVPDLLTDA
jgi:hypothetical protein